MSIGYKGDCIDYKTLRIANGDLTVTSIPLDNHANRAVLQFFIDVDTSSFPASKIGYTPIVNVCEDETIPEHGFEGNGLGVLNFGIYEVIGRNNLKNIKFILFAPGYDLFCKINYYK